MRCGISRWLSPSWLLRRSVHDGLGSSQMRTFVSSKDDGQPLGEENDCTPICDFITCHPSPGLASATPFAAFVATTGSTNFFTIHQLLCDYSLRRVVRHNPTSKVKRTLRGISAIDQPHSPSVELADLGASGGGTAEARKHSLSSSVRALRDADQSAESIGLCLMALASVTMADIVGPGAADAALANYLEPTWTLPEYLCDDVDLEFAALVTNAITMTLPLIPHAANVPEAQAAIQSASSLLPPLAACFGAASSLLVQETAAIVERQRLEALEAERKLKASVKSVGAVVMRDPGAVGRLDPKMRLAELARVWETFLVGGLWALQTSSSNQEHPTATRQFISGMVCLSAGNQMSDAVSKLILPRVSVSTSAMLLRLLAGIPRCSPSTTAEGFAKVICLASSLITSCGHVISLDTATLSEVSVITRSAVRLLKQRNAFADDVAEIFVGTFDSACTDLINSCKLFNTALCQRLQRLFAAPDRSTSTQVVCNVMQLISGELSLAAEVASGTSEPSIVDDEDGNVSYPGQGSQAGKDDQSAESATVDTAVVQSIDLCMVWLKGGHASLALAEIMATSLAEPQCYQAMCVLSFITSISESPFAVRRYKQLPKTLWELCSQTSQSRCNNTKLKGTLETLFSRQEALAINRPPVASSHPPCTVIGSGPLDYKLASRRVPTQHRAPPTAAGHPNSHLERPPSPSVKSNFRFSSKIRGPRGSMPKWR